MPMSPILLLHISGAVVGLISGTLSMIFRKGSSLHRVAGTFFFVSMMCMSGAGAYIAAFIHPVMANVLGGLLTFYLVVTAWRAGRHREARIGAFEYSAFIFGSLISVFAFSLSLQAAQSVKHGFPPTGYFIFGTIALLFVSSDLRMIVRGGLDNVQRIRRHLNRMCIAFLIAVFSFFPGQAKLFSRAARATPVYYLPHILLVLSLFYWLIRVSRRKRRERDSLVTATPVLT